MICKAVGNNNYSNGLSETLMQIPILPEKLSQSLLWNRFCNTRGDRESNIAIDLFMEHENKYFKEQLKTYRGEYTQAPIDRISKSQSLISCIIRTIDVETNTRTPGSKKTPPISNDDVSRLVEVFRPAQLLAYADGRHHSPQLVFTTRNLLKSLSATEVRIWLEKKIKYLKTCHYYKQHHEHNSTTSPVEATESDERLFADLEQSFNDSLTL